MNPDGRSQPRPGAGGRGAAALLLGLVALSAALYRHTWYLPPCFHHTWAQADWLAIALNFRQRGFDFFHPATYNLLTRAGYTGAGFPLPAYLSAGLMQLSGSEAPGLMRLFTLGCSLGGLLALAGLTRRASGSGGRAALVALFAFCAPLYGYYQASFLPSVPAFAAALAGYYCFYRFAEPGGENMGGERGHWGGGRGRWLGAAVMALALAAAMRTPFAIALLASLPHALGRGGQPGGPGRARVAVAYGAAALFVGGYFAYNDYLTHRYGGSMFLARPLPFHSLGEAVATTRLVADKWGLALLSRWQWLALAGAAAGAAASRPWAAWRRSAWAVHWLLLAGGGAAYYLLMGPQYIDHDYYFIDSLLLPLVLLAAGALAVLPPLPRQPWQRVAGLGLAAGLALLWGRATFAEQARRYTALPGDLGEHVRGNFTGGARLLDSLGISRQARVMVLDAYTFNQPLVLLQRRGWTVLTTSQENLQAACAEPADWVITQNAFFRSDCVTNYPLLPERLDSVFSNGRLTLWRPRRGPVPVRWQAGTDLETLPDTATWHNRTRSTERALSGRFASYLPAAASYSLTYAQTAGALGLRGGEHLAVRLACWLPPGGNYSAKLVVSLEPAAGGAAYSWQAVDCRRYQGPPGRWTIVGHEFGLPPPRRPADVLKVYVLKTGPVALWLDDVSLVAVRR